jgi:putative addiction module CopG family antidote
MFDKFVAELIASGLYQSQSEVIRDGLRLLKEREGLRKLKLEELQREIHKEIAILKAACQVLSVTFGITAHLTPLAIADFIPLFYWDDTLSFWDELLNIVINLLICPTRLRWS